MPQSLRQDLLMILGMTLGITALSILLGLDLSLADYLRNFQLDWARTIATNGYLPGVIGAGCSAMYLLLAAFISRVRSPLYLRLAGVWFFCFVFGSICIINGLRIAVGRARPHQVMELSGTVNYSEPFASLTLDPDFGENYNKNMMSFPSSQAGFGFLVCTPFFVLRRRAPKLAQLFLFAGILWASCIGLGRMVTMKHFLTDIVWSGAFILSCATFAAHLRLSYIPDEAAL